MSKFRREVFTIHGINSRGEWQDEVREALEPYFRCKPLRYPQFRRLGWLKIFNGWLRRRALKTIAQQFSREVRPGTRPHLIAHSFGTWIAAQLIKRPSIQLDRVVFVGSPLPSRFDWRGELTDNPEAFHELTNEVGLQDSVIELAGKIGKIYPLFGNAGKDGFTGNENLVHDTGFIRVSCPTCKNLTAPERARIHNVRWQEFTHSDWFVGNSHSANLWLPYFWGIAPEEYSEFIDLCLRTYELESRQELLELLQAESDFRARAWSWTTAKGTVLSLGEYVRESIPAHLSWAGRSIDGATLEHVCARAIRLVWVVVADAIEERKKPEQRDESLVLRLHPQTAINAAIDYVLKTV